MNCTNACSECNVTGCITCTNGFYLNNVTLNCSACPPNCATCNNWNDCTSTTWAPYFSVISYTGTLSNQTSTIVLCPTTCTKCSTFNPQICTQCVQGYQVDNNGLCYACNPGCFTCNSSSPTQCFTCYPNDFLVGSTCYGCTGNCLTCNGANSSTCTTCYPGWYLNSTGSNCIQNCPYNCITCSSQYVCTLCLPGYTLFSFSNPTQVLCMPCQ